MDASCATMSSKEWKRSRTKYHIETIFSPTKKPPESLTSASVSYNDNNCQFSSESGFCGGYIIIDYEPVFQQISLLVKCRICSGIVTFSVTEMCGLGFKLVLECENCGVLGRINSSKLVGPTQNDYEINARNELACQYLVGSSDSIKATQPNLSSQANTNIGICQEQELFSDPLGVQDETRLGDQSTGDCSQSTQEFFSGNEWSNHSMFDGSQANALPIAQGNWQIGPSSDNVKSDNEFESDDDDDDDDSEGSQQPSLDFQNATQNNCVTSESHTPSKKRRRAVKKAREEGQRLTSDTPLPDFSSYVLEELLKPTPRMNVVLPPCKAHIVAVTGDEYPTKKEYDIFCLKMILAFPSLRDPDTDHGYERFKKSLSASFRARRSYEKNIKPSRMVKRSGNMWMSTLGESLPLGVDASKLDFCPQPSTSNSTLGNRSEDDEHSRDMQRSLSESGWQEDSDSEASDLSGSRPNIKRRRRAVKKVRAEGQRLTSDTPLPDFAPDVLAELAKPAPRMTVVLPTCKAHIVAVTGDEYPTKKEYDIFCLKMILAFPSLKDPDTDHGYDRFKKSLSASFRARRSYELNKKPNRLKKRSLAMAMQQPGPQANELRFHHPPQNTMDEEMRMADEELANPDCDIKPDQIQYLIEKSFNLRKKAVSSPGFDVLMFLETYRHLSNFEMLLHEYSLVVGISIEELRENFDEGSLVLTKMFWESSQLPSTNEDLRRVQVLVQLQEHFLNQRHPRPDTKPLFVIKHQMAAFNDGDFSFRSTEVPCAVVLTNDEGRISKLMVTFRDRIVMEKYLASAFDVCSSLLAFFFILNVKYPPVYLDNLKALERLLNKKLSFASLQTTISSPYSNYVKLYDAKLKETMQYFRPTE
ncbi:uncharacterized protein LOC117644613 isoform X2 [Thrips palmi]|uniref:Uncharacterized protein LOC117644613 isoform X2 n=1 Tax=Thrips palmi TaxID=161013 RepID=A0A6P8YJS1_THRPL|nr:uncharacterized protein LOC117644613 isoform X2 [Thrips palmi]